MPRVGVLNGHKVYPYDVPSDARVQCVACGEEMLVQDEHYRDGEKVPRLFAHVDRSDCGGESDTHMMMKQMAIRSLNSRFPDANVTDEEMVGDDHIADVLCTFESPRFPLGNGIVVEAQYKNKGKDFKRTVSDFTQNGYSVYWAYWPDFKDEDDWMQIDDDRFVPVWPTAAPRVDGIDGYPECVRHFFDPDRAATTTELTVNFPAPIQHEIVNTHIFNIISLEWFSDRDFKSSGKGWLHSKGRVVAWAQVFNGYVDDETIHTLLEVSRKDTKNGTREFVTLPITKGDVDALYDFSREVKSVVNDKTVFGDDVETGDVFARVDIDGKTPGEKGWIEFRKEEQNGLEYGIGYERVTGTSHEIQIDYREGDARRFHENVCGIVYSNCKGL